ncbi:MAG TPA: PQQ-dependent sugar dehydrogenase [Patescibacteria group bacterium]|nr:PQQ-dependent sugar dehydrogenase [Patescibacteria group bacterium]
MKKIALLVILLFLLGVGVVARNQHVAVSPVIPVPTKLFGREVSTLKVPTGYAVRTVVENLNTPRDLLVHGGILYVSEMNGGKVDAINLSDFSVHTLLSNLKRPHGLAIRDGFLYVAQETSVNRYVLDEQNLTAIYDNKVLSLPTGGRHFTRSLVFDDQGNFYVSVGSTCDVCNEKDDRLAAIMQTSTDGKSVKIFSKGLRNSVFITKNPKTGAIWGTEMGRDFLGDDIPPDEINIFSEGGNYGWPNCYGDKVFDTKGASHDSSVCANTIPPVYKIPAHSAPLGLTFDPDGNLLVAYHGSWNRSVPDGYKIVKLTVKGNSITGSQDFITGFISGNAVIGRPVDVEYDSHDNLFISDDKAGVIYRVTKDVLGTQK